MLEGQWNIALRDLRHAVGLDANGDGAGRPQRAAVAVAARDRLDVQARERIKRDGLLARLQLTPGNGAACALG
jgi:hypothetical protein